MDLKQQVLNSKSTRVDLTKLHPSVYLWPKTGIYSWFWDHWRLKSEHPKSPTCHKHRGHRCSLVNLRHEPRDNRPTLRFTDHISTFEIFHLATEFRKDMGEDMSDNPRDSRVEECYFTCPVNSPIEAASYLDYQLTKPQHLTIMADDFARWRVFQSYFDGQFHISFTEVLDIEHLLPGSKTEMEYAASFDRADYLKKTNILLKWAWPLTQGECIVADPLLKKQDTWQERLLENLYALFEFVLRF